MTAIDSRRLASLLASAERMAGGDVEHRAEISTEHDELDALGYAINVIVGELSYTARGFERAKHDAELRTAELAAAQAELVRSERSALLGQLAGGLAHQIRNPLAAIMNATFILARHLPPGTHTNVDGSIEIVRDEIRHANRIITALLDFARVRALSRQPTCIEELVEDVLATPSISETIRVERSLMQRTVLDVDVDQLREAVLNIVRNALEAMPDGGTLGVRIDLGDRELALSITDTGVGIASEVRAHLFEPLRSTKPLGVGLGLVKARTIVEAHGGRVVHVPVPVGARFEIRLPMAEPR
jgi:signal transduction histidine kinase